MAGETILKKNQKNAEGFVKSGFFFGYFITQVPGGRLSEMFGTKRVFGTAMFLCSCLTALTPVITYAKLSTMSTVWCLFVLRVLQGLFQGVCFPGLLPVTIKWSPIAEMGKFMSFIYMGGTFGTVLTYPLMGIVLANMSWVWVFFLSSILSFAWFILWVFFMVDLPENDPYISEKEKNHIISTRMFDGKLKDTTPILPLTWDILKTPAAWTNMLCSFCSSFGTYVLLTEGNDFISKILPIGEDIATNGWISASPYICRTLLGNLAGILNDYIIGTGKVSKHRMTKLNQTVAFLIPAAGILGMSYLVDEKTQYWSISVMAIAYGFSGATVCGFTQNLVIIAPNKSGTLFGVVNGFGNISGFLVPLVKTWVVDDVNSIDDWRKLFIIAACCYCAGTLIFVTCASRHVQHFDSKNYENLSTLDYARKSCFNFDHLRGKSPRSEPSIKLVKLTSL